MEKKFGTCKKKLWIKNKLVDTPVITTLSKVYGVVSQTGKDRNNYIQTPLVLFLLKHI